MEKTLKPAESPKDLEQCSNCRFGAPTASRPVVDGSGRVGSLDPRVRCRRYPQHMVKHREDWCGEWKLG